MRNTSYSAIPSPNEWLRFVISQKHISNTSIAQLVGCSSPQVSRWLSAVETIPLEHLLCISQALFPQSTAYVCLLKNCEEMKKALQKSCRRFQDTLSIELDIFPRVENMIADLVSNHDLSNSQLAEVYLHHLTATRFAICLLIEAISSDFVQPIIPTETPNLFRHPMNQVVGWLLSLSSKIDENNDDHEALCDFRESALVHLRQKTLKPLRKGNPLQLAQQSSFYFLSRYGNREDQVMVQDLLSQSGGKTDLLVRRFIYSGVIQGNDPDLEEKYIYELQRDPEFALISLQFDAFHYGDIDLDTQKQLPKETRQYHHAIEHILRHLQNQNMYPCIQEVESLKIMQLANLVGKSVLITPQALQQIKQIKEFGILSKAPKNSMRQKLLSFFHHVDGGSIYQGQQEPKE